MDVAGEVLDAVGDGVEGDAALLGVGGIKQVRERVVVLCCVAGAAGCDLVLVPVRSALGGGHDVVEFAVGHGDRVAAVKAAGVLVGEFAPPDALFGGGCLVDVGDGDVAGFGEVAAQVGFGGPVGAVPPGLVAEGVIERLRGPGGVAGQFH